MAPYDRAALRLAIRQRNIARLEQILDSVQDNGLGRSLSGEVEEARKLLKILRRLVSVKMSLQGLTQAMLCQLVNQTHPHKITVTILRAVFVVLGDEEDDLQRWADIQERLGTLPHKHYNFIRAMVRFNSQQVKLDNAQRAMKLMSKFNLDLERVKSISEPLALFYTWLNLITQEVLSIAEIASTEGNWTVKKTPR